MPHGRTLIASRMIWEFLSPSRDFRWALTIDIRSSAVSVTEMFLYYVAKNVEPALLSHFSCKGGLYFVLCDTFLKKTFFPNPDIASSV